MGPPMQVSGIYLLLYAWKLFMQILVFYILKSFFVCPELLVYFMKFYVIVFVEFVSLQIDFRYIDVVL